MRRPLISIALAFAGSLCVASGLALVLPLAPTRFDRRTPPTASATSVAAVAAAPTPAAGDAVGEVPFLPDRTTATGVGEPSRPVTQSIRLDVGVAHVCVVVE